MIHLFRGSVVYRYCYYTPAAGEPTRTKSYMPQAGALHPPRFSTACRSYSEPVQYPEGLFSSVRGDSHLSEVAREGQARSAATAVVVNDRRPFLSSAPGLSVSACAVTPEGWQ